jgi:hypothetical protein
MPWPPRKWRSSRRSGATRETQLTPRPDLVEDEGHAVDENGCDHGEDDEGAEPRPSVSGRRGAVAAGGSTVDARTGNRAKPTAITRKKASRATYLTSLASPGP